MKETTTGDLVALAPAPGASATEVQDWMGRLLIHRRSLKKSEAMQRAAALHFSGNERLSPAEQIDIYRQQFWLRHTKILIEDFPGVTGLLGQEAWEKVAESYLNERAFNVVALRDLGFGLPEHLESQPDLFNQRLLVDMAHLECAYLRAFDCADDCVLSAEKVAQIPPDAWPEARIRLSHSIELLELKYPVADLRRQVKQTPQDIDKTKISPEPNNLVVYRRNDALFDKRVSRPAFLLLRQFQAGQPLIPACETVVEQEPSAAQVFDEQLMQWFSLWGRLGWITDVDIS